MVDLDDLYGDGEAALLLLIVEERYAAMLRGVHELVLAAYGDRLGALGISFTLDDPAVRTMLNAAAEQVVRIDETTRAGIREQLKIASERGYSPWQAARGVSKDGYRGIHGLFSETWRHRPETVARTELANAQVLATHDRYAATGFISRVRIHDGRDWDEPCRSRDGTVVPLSDRPMINHPNCVMALAPVVDE